MARNDQAYRLCSRQEELTMKRSLTSKIALGGAVAAMSLGMVACDVEGDDTMDPGMEEPADDGLGDDF
jgi:NO-binding membrane sensor protein with MHYT domain